MKRKYSYKRLNSLWEKSNSKTINLTYGSAEAYYKKSMDDICFQAELAESNIEYAHAICHGMKHLYKLGVPVEMIQKHHNLLHKLFYLGRDLMDSSKGFNDLFYLGVFIELKIIDKWKEKSFFDFLVSAISGIKKEFVFMSKRICDRLSNELRINNKSLYNKFFLESQIA